jgi:hypothetical protein
MPQIIVTAGGGGVEEGTVVLRERVNATDFESDRFAANLLERLGWAVEDATAAERHGHPQDIPKLAPEPDVEPEYAWEPDPVGVS